MQVFIDGIDHIFINELGPVYIDHQRTVCRDGFQFAFEHRFAEKGYVFFSTGSGIYLHPALKYGSTEITPDYIKYAEPDSYQYAF